MVARLHEHVTHGAAYDAADNAAYETAQETIACISDGLVEGGDSNQHGGRRQEFTKYGGTLR